MHLGGCIYRITIYGYAFTNSNWGLASFVVIVSLLVIDLNTTHQTNIVQAYIL